MPTHTYEICLQKALDPRWTEWFAGLMLAITQSGETVDTLAAMDEGRQKDAHLTTIGNVVDSQAAWISDSVIYMHTGPEIGVASTKAFTASLVDQYLLALHLGVLRGTLSKQQQMDLSDALAALPDLVGKLCSTLPVTRFTSSWHRPSSTTGISCTEATP